ncbi:Ttc19 [Phodopus roborovskii]|uniref:Tetratricopeptide repeat protein 19, mitochondrial n=1 Tax=Phodopus roborovskii TaxID=109678 RepID=A0AAU9Z0G7_PHORO|nr:Ttc19 [Phodopus roborovskii]
MFRLLRWRLGRTLLRAAGRRCGGCAARLLPERTGDTGPGAEGRPSRGTSARGQRLLPLLAALAWFSRPAAAGEHPGEDAADEAEAEIIQLLKRAKLSIMKDEPEAAELILHDALRLAFQSDNKKAISYTYDLAEQLFKATMSYLLGGGMKQKANTYLLLGMCLDSCARYLLFSKQLSQAQRMYEKALQICQEIQGERHPQTIVLMSDLATTLDAQGHFDDAYIYMQKASDLAREINHPELHMVLSNLAAILIHRERYTQAKEIYQEALKQAELKRDEVSVQHIRQELAELSRKSRLLT